MNRIDRLFAITVLLQARRRVRAMDLATLFEVSERTIYRDIEALNESDIPIISTPGAGYELSENFYLPALQLTTEGAKVLFLGAEMLKSQASGPLLSSVESALAKIAGAFPDTVAEEAARLVDILRFIVQPGRLDFDDPRLMAFQAEVVRWVRERQHYAYTGEEPDGSPDGEGESELLWNKPENCLQLGAVARVQHGQATRGSLKNNS